MTGFSISELYQKNMTTPMTSIPVSTNVVDDDNQILNQQISEAEVLLAIRKIKPRKVAGPGGIIGEIIKHASGQVTDFFVIFFNTLFGPSVWNSLPLHIRNATTIDTFKSSLITYLYNFKESD